MSEDPNQLPGEPDPSNEQSEPPAQEPISPEPQPEQAPAQPSPSEQPQYPPPPSFYEQRAGEDPYGSPITAPPVGYGAPPYVQPLGYGVPPLTPPPGYGVPLTGYPTPPYGYASFQPPAQPLPLGQAIRELPSQYAKIVKKPSAQSFTEEQTKADWGIIWMQLLFSALLTMLSTLTTFTAESHLLSSFTSSLPSTVSSPNPFALFSSISFTTVTAVVAAIISPLLFFGQVGIQYLLARLFRGNGEFKQQAYNQLLFVVPIQVIVGVLYLLVALLFLFIPGPLTLVIVLLPLLVGSGLGIYSIILNVFSIMATHRVSGGKAAGVVLIPYAVLYVLYFIFVFGVLLISLSSLS